MFLTYLIIFIAGLATGFINTLAGSGSLIMLPLLMGAGLPATIANGTNRVSVLVQSAIGAATFAQNKKLPLKGSAWTLIPTLFGALLGAWLATQVSAEFLKDFIGYLMLMMLGVILIKPKKWFRENNPEDLQNRSTISVLLMFGVGFYGGFIQAGVGIFLLAGLVLVSKYNLAQANALKLLVVFFYALPVLAVFIYYNQVDWFLGLFTAVGQGIGAFVGARFATRYPNADVWVYRLLVLVVVVSVIYFFKLWEWFFI